TVYLAARRVLLCLADSDGARCRPLSLVTDAALAPGDRGHCHGGLIHAHVPGLSRKLFPLGNGACSAGTMTDGDHHRTLSLRASPDVCRWSLPVSGDTSAAGLLVRSPADPALPPNAPGARGAGGTHAAPGVAGLCYLYDTRQVSPHPLCLVRRPPGAAWCFQCRGAI